MKVIRALALALVWGVTIPKLGGERGICAEEPVDRLYPPTCKASSSPDSSKELPTKNIICEDFPSVNGFLNFSEKAPCGFDNKADENNKAAVVFFKDCNQHKDGKPLRIMESGEVKVKYTCYNEDKEDIKNSHGERKIYLCGHDMGRGFEIGIEGMHRGCSRRIIIPLDLLPQGPGSWGNNIESYAFCDVELVKAKAKWLSWQCSQIAEEFSSFGKWVLKPVHFG